ncbi:MAG: DUF4153 domain-containing protein [Akkermansia sp.]
MNTTFSVAPPPQDSAPLLKPWAPPSWWTSDKRILFLALLAGPIAIDLSFFFITNIGLGFALGNLLFAFAFLQMRIDYTPRERAIFLSCIGVQSLSALLYGGITTFFISFAIILIFNYIPRTDVTLSEKNPDLEIRPMGLLRYWAHQLHSKAQGKNKYISLAFSLGIGLLVFFILSGIVALSNPIVAEYLQKVYNFIYERLAHLLAWERLITHILLWIAGALFFTCLEKRRPYPCKPKPEKEKPVSTASALTGLPCIILLAVNAAIILSNGADLCFLWKQSVPHGVSLTEYLYHGTYGLMFVSAFALITLLIFFRHRGFARSQPYLRIIGYALLAQCVLLAIGVGMRLYFQMDHYGFTAFRIISFFILIAGMIGIWIVKDYVCKGGLFKPLLKKTVFTSIGFTFLLQIISPNFLAVQLNIALLDSHPHWNFTHYDLSQSKMGIVSLPLVNKLIEKGDHRFHDLQINYTKQLNQANENWRSLILEKYYLQKQCNISQ